MIQPVHTALLLRQAYTNYHRSPVHKDRTAEDYLRSISHWETLMGPVDCSALTNDHLRRFQQLLLTTPLKKTGKPPAVGTVRKVMREVRAILSTIGPPSVGNPYGLGIVPYTPICRPLEPQRTPVVTISDQECAAIDRCCATVPTWPPKHKTGVEPTVWWSCLFPFLLFVGSRRNEFLQIETRHVDLKRGTVQINPLKRGSFCSKVLHPQVVDRWRQMLPNENKYWFGIHTHSKEMYSEWHWIQREAGVYVRRPDGSYRKPYYGFHEVRKTCGTMLYEISPGAAQQQLGHSSPVVTQQSYANLNTITQNVVSKVHLPLWDGAKTSPPPAPGGGPVRVYAG